MKVFPAMVSLLLLAISVQAQAWWNTPYGYSQSRMGYWPSVWPAYVQPQNSYRPQYNGWNVKGSMNQRGDTHFVIEYHGNVYDRKFGNNYGYPRNQNSLYGWRR